MLVGLLAYLVGDKIRICSLTTWWLIPESNQSCVTDTGGVAQQD